MSRFRERMYGQYTDSAYRARNDLTEAGIRRASAYYRTHFGPHLPPQREARILEVGCGSGALLVAMRELGYHDLHGIDIAPGQVALCHSLGFEQVVQADVTDFLQHDDRLWDGVVLADVVEHLQKDEVLEVLDAIRERLSPGGRVILRVPNMSNPLNVRSRYVDFTHEVGFSKESISQVLRVTGFEVRSVTGEFTPHRRRVAHWVFDTVLWWLFQLLSRHVLYLHQEMLRGKNLIAVAVRSE